MDTVAEKVITTMNTAGQLKRIEDGFIIKKGPDRNPALF
jgi:hypothetical protein